MLGVLALILNRTSFGLHMRAVTQNRDMAAVMGIRTARVDALTFGLGSGIAGMAGVALSQIGNVSPNLGTIYIVDSFLVVVFGGVGNLLGTLVGALIARHRQQDPRAGRRRDPRQDRRAGGDHPVHPAAAARPVRAQGPHRRGGGLSRCAPAGSRMRGAWSAAVLGRVRRRAALVLVVVVPVLNLCVSRRIRRSRVPDYLVPLLGKYLCYAILALSLDLVWGYAGILSLGHGAFFALGGYAMGMYLMRQIGTRGVYQNPILPDFMVFLQLEGAAVVLVRASTISPLPR